MVKIGIGCTTYDRPECLAKWKEQIRKHTSTSFDVTYHIADDSIERKGVAFRKNECLRALKDCDYVFLFDDDCYPIKDGWIDFFTSKVDKHLLYLNGDLHAYIANSEKGYRDCGGVFMYMTKDVIESIGAFDEKYGLYGFEHADYSLRIKQYTKSQYAYNCYSRTKEYIYAEDYNNKYNHKSSITNKEKDLLFKKNFPIFAKGIDKIYIPL